MLDLSRDVVLRFSLAALLICAGARADVEMAEVIGASIEPRGVSLCIVELHDVRPLRRSDWVAAQMFEVDCVESGLFAWLLRNARRVEQRAVKGRLGLFEWA